jgi:NAD(P)-dependent dehydrogenase (short-subunit alcohol dehydrogenase family)
MGVLDGKVAIVTGSARGIGRETALMFGREGAKVVVNDLGGEVDGSGGSHLADEVVTAIRAAGGEAVASYDTVATTAGGKAIFEQAISSFGACDILVNNAGILRDRTIFKMEEDDWDAVIDVHLKGHYNCSRPFAQYIRDTNRQNCRIICFSSVSGLYGNFGQSNYGAAKAGIAGFARVMALELAKYGCTVNTISPGASTRMTIELRKARGAKVDVDAPDQSPRQIAPVVTWLCSDAGQEMNAQIWDIMQGWVGIMQQPAVIKSFTTGDHWTLRDLDVVIPSLMQAKQRHDERVKQEGAPEALGKSAQKAGS